MIEKLVASGLSAEVIVVILSVLPVIELRGALPVAINLFHLPWYEALYLAIIGNMLPVPFLLLFFGSIAKVIGRTRTGKKLVDWIFKRTRRHIGAIGKYDRIGLMLFIAIPVPGTGAWTGSIAAVLCGLRFKHALLSSICGVTISGAIVASLCLIGWVGAVIAGLGLSILAIIGLWKL